MVDFNQSGPRIHKILYLGTIAGSGELFSKTQKTTLLIRQWTRKGERGEEMHLFLKKSSLTPRLPYNSSETHFIALIYNSQYFSRVCCIKSSDSILGGEF